MMPQLLKEQNITNSILYCFEHHRIQSLTKLLNLQMKIHRTIHGKQFSIVKRFLIEGQLYYSVKYVDGKFETFSELALLNHAPYAISTFNLYR